MPTLPGAELPGTIPINVQTNTDLDIHVLTTTYGYLRLRAERLTGRSGLDLADLGVSLELQRGDLRLRDLHVRLPQGYAKGSSRLHAGQEPPAAWLTFEGGGLDLGRAIARVGDDQILTGALDVEADLRSRLDSLEAILPTLEGELAFLVEGGTDP